MAESSADHLVVGQALSSSQIANLTSDIVWYVSEQVNGQTVLVPTLYLADSSKINANGATLASGGALLTSGSLLIADPGADAVYSYAGGALSRLPGLAGVIVYYVVVLLYWLMICQLATRMTSTPNIQGGSLGSSGT